MKFRITLFITIFLIAGIRSIAQEVISTAGFNGSNVSGSLDWTIGEPVVETYTSANNNLTQGFQQSTVTVTSIDTYNNSADISAYPNPVNRQVNIVHNNDKTIEVEMYDAAGQFLLRRTLSGIENSIDISLLANGIYFVRVYNTSNNLIKILKVDKVK
jgi:hypothetical protein